MADDLEKYLAEAIEKNTPDILDRILEDLDDAGQIELAEFEEVSARPSAYRRGGILKAAAGIAAALLIFVGAASVLRTPQSIAVVGLDVNPSIELSVSDDGKVISASAVNQEGGEILSHINVKGADVDAACHDVVGEMIAGGYLTDTSNSILVSVRADDREKGYKLEQELSGSLNSYMESSDIAASILGQYVEDDDELEAYAESNGISLGKAWLIRSILADGSAKANEGSLLKLSTQELILLGQKRNISSETSVSYGKADTSSYIGEEKAAEAALNNAGLSRSQVSDVRVEYDSEDGLIVYEVEFTFGGTEYEYDINAVTGEILSHETESADGSSSSDADDDDEDEDDIDDSEDDDIDDSDDDADDDDDGDDD